MTEEKRDKVINGLECHLGNDKNHYDCDNCQYGPMNNECDAKLFADALALLKAQEPVKPTLDIRHGKSMWRCGSCSTALQPNQINAKFCFNCGRAVRWE